MVIKEVYKNTEEKIKRSIEGLVHQLSSLRTGRASLALIEHIKVEYYGSLVPINQVANVSIPEARTIEIKPWDKVVIKEIEKSIQKSDLGITPVNDGKIIRLVMPSLTQERRMELVKIVKKIGEKYRVSARNIRREEMDVLKKAEKKKQISEDDMFQGEEHIQKIIDESIKKIDEIGARKEKEVMGI
ncbi:ribosome recycling factor [bacterium]|nr:ribosome recycling factor [bacterium]